MSAEANAVPVKSEEKEHIDEMRICRMCFCGENEENGDAREQEELISICHCKGSSKYVHQSCYLSWIHASGKENCPTCRYKVKLSKKLKPLSRRTLALFTPEAKNFLMKIMQAVSVVDHLPLMKLYAFCTGCLFLIGWYFGLSMFGTSKESRVFIFIVDVYAIVFLSYIVYMNYQEIKRQINICLEAFDVYVTKLGEINKELVIEPITG